MKPEDQIIFLAELVTIINELQELVRDYCQDLTTEPDDEILEPATQPDDVPF